MIFRGFWMVSWFKQQFGLREMQRAKELGVAPETLFDELVNSVPAGSMGLMLQPYWSPGIREPGLEACTGRSSKAWPTPCARARRRSRNARGPRSSACVCPVAARKATRPCN